MAHDFRVNEGPRYRGDGGIANGVIARIGAIDAGICQNGIDATGLVVAPGHVDLHTH